MRYKEEIKYDSVVEVPFYATATEDVLNVYNIKPLVVKRKNKTRIPAYFSQLKIENGRIKNVELLRESRGQKFVDSYNKFWLNRKLLLSTYNKGVWVYYDDKGTCKVSDTEPIVKDFATFQLGYEVGNA
jgi:hypothetical protein